MSKVRKKRYYHNSVENKMFEEGKQPKGWVLGMLPVTKEEREKRSRKRKKTNLEKYGTEFPTQSKKVKEKYRETCIEKYGVDNVSKVPEFGEKRRKTCLERFGDEVFLRSDIAKNRIKETNLERYGVENPFQSEEVKEKIKHTNLKKYGVSYPYQSKEVQAKLRDTCKEHYGVEYPLQSEEVQKKRRETCLERYGVEYPSQSKEVRKKIRKSCLERYGVDNVSKSEEIKERMRETNLERYGVDCSSKSEKVKEKARKTNLERYGVPWTCMREEYTHGTMSSSDSGPNLKFAKLLDNNSISYEREYPLGDYLYDFKIGKFLVEIDPTYTHNSFMGPFGGTGLSKEYHYSKSITSKENGFFCIHVFDWNRYGDIVDRLSTYYHNPKFVWYDSSESSSDSITIGTDSDFMSFHSLGGSDYVVDSIHTIHGLDYLKPYFSEFLKSNSVSSIELVSDSCKYDVHCVKRLGFQLVEETPIRCNWYNHKSQDLIVSDGVSDDTEFDTMVYSGYLPVYDCGQSVYMWKPNIL